MVVVKVSPEEFLGGQSVVHFGNPMGHPPKKDSKPQKDKVKVRKEKET
jgi:hypothetical protein